jgi:acyl-coenzyme A thioesterase PaaI-like protein
LAGVDYEAIRGGLEQAIPFNAHLGLQVAEVGPARGVVRLPDDARLRNHVGSQHAGALFAAGEAASGATFVGAFADVIGEVTPLATGARIEYRRIARGEIVATGRLEESHDGLRSRLRDEGVVHFPVHVTLVDGAEELVAEMVVDWHVKRRA